MGEAVACEEQRSDLVDVSRLGLAEVRALDESAIAHAVRRLLAEVDEPQGAIAGWQSAA